MRCRICESNLKSTDYQCPNCNAIIDEYCDSEYDYISDLDEEDLKYFLG